MYTLNDQTLLSMDFPVFVNYANIVYMVYICSNRVNTYIFACSNACNQCDRHSFCLIRFSCGKRNLNEHEFSSYHNYAASALHGHRRRSLCGSQGLIIIMNFIRIICVVVTQNQNHSKVRNELYKLSIHLNRLNGQSDFRPKVFWRKDKKKKKKCSHEVSKQ